MDWRLTFGGLLVLILGGVASGQTSPADSLNSGGSTTQPTAAKLGALHSIHWQRLPLGDALERLNGVSNVVVFLDRRVDPSRRVSLSLEDATVDQFAAELAGASSLGTSRFVGLTYLGPAESARRLATLAALRRQEVARLPAESRRALSRRRRMGWPRLTEPRDLVVQWAREQGWHVRQSERVPHDLWPAGQLPPLPVADQFTLLLAGFDLTFRLIPAEAAIEIVPIEDVPMLTRVFAAESLEPAKVDQLAQQFPEAKLELADGRLRAEAWWEDLDQIAQLVDVPQPARRATRPRPAGKQVFTLRVEEQPVGAVLEALARQLKWELVVDEAAIRRAGRSLDRRVSLAVEKVEIDELLDAILQPAGLTFEREAERVRIGPR